MTEKKHLATIFLRYGSGAKPLTTLAFSQLITKILFLARGPLSEEKISLKITDILNIKNVSRELIGDSLLDLKEDGKIFLRKEKWELSREAKDTLVEEIDLLKKIKRKVVKDHFISTTNKLDYNLVDDWFDDAASDFFSYFSEDWIKSVCKGTNLKKELLKQRSIKDLILPSIRKANLTQHEKDLIQGFISFIQGETPNDNQYLMNLGFAALSAKLVASNLGTDNVVLQEIKDTTYILDTNFLLSIALESKMKPEYVEALGRALKKVNSKVVFLHETKEEYLRVVHAKKKEILSLLEIYDCSVVENAFDDFIKTAKIRGCKNVNDYERFFEDISQIPDQISQGIEINMEDDEVIQELTEKAKNNLGLQKQIKETCLSLRPKNMLKSTLAIKHDAALITIAEKFRSDNERYLVLTKDKILLQISLNRTGNHEMPLVLTPDTLAQLLAIDNAGPDFDPSDYAPLLSGMLINRCTPPVDTFTPEDMHLLYNLDNRISDLPPEEVQEIAIIVAKERMSGKKMDDKNFQLKVNRLFQKKELSVKREVEDYQRRAAQAEKSIMELQKENNEYRAEKLKKNAWKNFILKKLIPKGLLSSGLACIVFFITKEVITRDNGASELDIMNTIATMISFVIPFFYSLKSDFSKLRRSIKKANHLIHAE